MRRVSNPEKSLCYTLNIPTEVFFPDQDHLGKIAYAKAICSVCSNKDECLEVALENREEFGIWGGCTESDRRTIRVRRVMLEDSSRRNKLREQVHPKSASPSFLLHTFVLENHTQEALYSDFVQRLSSRVSGIEVSRLQSLEEFPSGHSQKPLFVRILDELRNFRKSLNLHLVDKLQFPEAIDPESDQIEEHESSDHESQSNPNLLSFQGLFQEV